MAVVPVPYDFRGKVMACNIFSPDTGKIATFSIGRSNQQWEHLPYFSQLVVKETINGFNEIQVQLTPPRYEDALKLLESPWLRIGNTMSVRWGYTRHVAHVTPWHHSFMLKPDIAFADEFSITVKGTSFGYLPARMTSEGTWSETNLPKGVKTRQTNRLDVIETIAKRYNFIMNLNFQKIDKKKAKPYSPEVLDMLTDVVSIHQTGLNDLMFMKKLAAECGCRLYITRGNVLNLIEASYATDPDYTLAYRGQIDPANDVYPIDSFDSDSTPLFLPHSGIDATLLNPNSPKSKLAKKWSANEQTTKQTAYSGEQVMNPDAQSPKMQGPDGQYLPQKPKAYPDGSPSYVPVTPGKEETERRIKNIFRVKDSNAETHGISAKCTGPDLPLLLPESMVKLRGVGKYFSVVYRVYEITHTIGADFARMEVDLRPKGFPGDMAKWMAIAAPKVQKYDPGKAKPASGVAKYPGRGSDALSGPPKPPTGLAGEPI